MTGYKMLRATEVVHLLEKQGFQLCRCHGSHLIFIHPLSKRRVVVPMHPGTLCKGTLHSILKQAGLDL